MATTRAPHIPNPYFYHLFYVAVAMCSKMIIAPDYTYVFTACQV